MKKRVYKINNKILVEPYDLLEINSEVTAYTRIVLGS